MKTGSSKKPGAQGREPRSLQRLVMPQWVAYADRRPPKAVRLVIGGGVQHGQWSMSSPFPAHLMPGEFGSCDADRTHWLAIPPAPKVRHNEAAHSRREVEGGAK